MEKKEIKDILHVLFFISDQAVPLETVDEVFERRVPRKLITECIEEIQKDYETRGEPIELRKIADGYQFATKQQYSDWVRRLFKDRITLKLSASAMETLAIVAYKQPLTRSEVEEIRGVEAVGVLETLMERKLVRIVGRKETVGRPLLYGTTPEFMRYFGLGSLSDLPSLEELKIPDSIAPEPGPGAPSEPEAVAEGMEGAQPEGQDEDKEGNS